MPYDASREALYHPELKPVFVQCDRLPRFNPDNSRCFPVNAWWLANAAHLAYYEASRVAPELARVGLRLTEFFSKECVQAYLAVAEAFAILAFRGTQCADLADLKADLDVRLVAFQDRARVHQGFLAALDEVWPELEERLQAIAALGLPTWYTGHSMGAALATLAAARRPPSALVTFASPRVGDEAFVRLLDGVTIQRVVNCCDLIVGLPLRSMGYQDAGELHFITSGGQLLVNPPTWQILWHKVVGTGRYRMTVPWFHPGVVSARSFADHSISNYTTALAQAAARLAWIPSQSVGNCII